MIMLNREINDSATAWADRERPSEPRPSDIFELAEEAMTSRWWARACKMRSYFIVWFASMSDFGNPRESDFAMRRSADISCYAQSQLGDPILLICRARRLYAMVMRLRSRHLSINRRLIANLEMMNVPGAWSRDILKQLLYITDAWRIALSRPMS